MFYDELIKPKHFGPAKTDVQLCTIDERVSGIVESVVASETRLGFLGTKQWVPLGVHDFSHPRLRPILEIARTHRNLQPTKKIGDVALFLVHPMYAWTRDTQYKRFNEEMQRQAQTYMNKLNTLLHLFSERDDVSIVLVEDPTAYLGATRVLHERGIVDKVYFTEFDCGELLYIDEYTDLETCTTLYFGGMYTKSCAKAAFAEVGKRTKGNLILVTDLTFDVKEETKPEDALPSRGTTTTLQKLIARYPTTPASLPHDPHRLLQE
jgi:uncharacterized protein with GYD domain